MDQHCESSPDGTSQRVYTRETTGKFRLLVGDRANLVLVRQIQIMLSAFAAVLSVVDLAGSERIKKSMSTGQRLKEAQASTEKAATTCHRCRTW
jgi:hypothetical protein